MLLTFFHLFSAVVAIAAAASSSAISFSVLHHARRDVPHGWSLHRRAEPDSPLPLKFALTQSNLHNLDAYLLDVADPHSPNYGKHWTPAKVAQTFRPSHESVDIVHSWLVDDAGIDARRIRLSPDGGALHLDVTVSEAERILAAKYYVYRHDEESSERIGCHHGYHLPAHVSDHVDFVWPTVHFGGARLSRRDTKSIEKRGGRRPSGPPRKEVVDESVLAPGTDDCDQGATLDCLRALYNFNYDIVSADKEAIGVFELGSNVYLQSDLDKFFRIYDPDQLGTTPTLISIAGGHLNESEMNLTHLGESTMDFQLVMGLLSRKQEVLLYQVSQNDTDEFFLDRFLAAMDGSYCSAGGVDALKLADCGNKPRPKVISFSYGSGFDTSDYDNEDAIPVIQRQCAEIGKLSLTGMTFVAASGDNGVYAGHDTICDAIKNATTNGQIPPFIPNFPASCPYVTAVGATEVAPGKSVYDRETATTAFASGGGFSNTFPRPSYQNRAVSRYLKNYIPPYGPDVFNRTGRAIPDVAANGNPTAVVYKGNLTTSGGTSASAPIFASLIVAVNDARLAAGKGPVGWINPALYTHAFASAFNDVINGTNVACGLGGFPTARGWDPVTGLGTPNFERLLARFMTWLFLEGGQLPLASFVICPG
ncbi:subtilisin-like protein [Fomes fomentarius]|nr:subtilisin-like protein [Fomes fomentarius]